MAERDPWHSPGLDRLREQLAAVAARDAERLRAGGAATAHRPRAGLVAGLAAAVAAAAVVVVLLLAGGDRNAARADVSDAPGAAARAGSMRFATRSVLEVPGRAPDRRSTVGEVDFRAGAYHARLNSLERIAIGRTLYARSRAGAPWVSVRLTRPFLAGGASSGVGSAALNDPVALFELLRHARTGVTRVGSERVDGVATTHWRFRRPLADVADLFAVPAGRRAALSGITADVDVWLDRRERPVRERHVLAGGRTGARLASQTDFTAYGRPVTLRPPRGARAVGAGAAVDTTGAQLVAELAGTPQPATVNPSAPSGP